ncbi:MAG: RNA polymerase sigma factor SigJ, partial [Oxalobacteraceae bacterium]
MTDISGHDLQALRPPLIRLAYRMLGSIVDAEDVVQDAFGRWLTSDRDTVREPAAFLRVIVTRLCLNVLASARVSRETYIGPWLPEPIFDPEDADPVDDITLPLMIALERLSPLQRAAFLLHDIFGMDFAQVGETIDRDPAACRQLASRARSDLRRERPRFPISKDKSEAVAAAFYSASRTGDMQRLRALLTQDVIAVADGGGKVPASLIPLVGIDAVMARHAEMAILFSREPSRMLRFGRIDGLPGFLTIEAGGVHQT